MTLINIGELVKLLSNDVRDNNRHIPWRSIAGLRDVVAHRYQSIKMEDIWNTSNIDVPRLEEQLGELINTKEL